MERVRKRYSLALKQKIMEEIRDGKWTSAWQASKMSGIKDQTVYKWMDKLGFSHLKTRIMEVKTLDEIDEVKQLRKQVRELKLALAEETLSRQIEQATVQVASSISGISVEELKKSWHAPRPSVRRPRGARRWITSRRKTIKVIARSIKPVPDDDQSGGVSCQKAMS